MNKFVESIDGLVDLLRLLGQQHITFHSVIWFMEWINGGGSKQITNQQPSIEGIKNKLMESKVYFINS